MFNFCFCLLCGVYCAHQSPVMCPIMHRQSSIVHHTLAITLSFLSQVQMYTVVSKVKQKKSPSKELAVHNFSVENCAWSCFQFTLEDHRAKCWEMLHYFFTLFSTRKANKLAVPTYLCDVEDISNIKLK